MYAPNKHKDPEALLTAYYGEFGADERVLLRVKTFSGKKLVLLAEKIKRSTGLDIAPEIEIVSGALSTPDLFALYDRSDAYVAAHHGEGWGMPIWEAMSVGLPAIATGWGGNLDFMKHEENSLLTGYSYDENHRWVDTNIEDLRRAMRRVYENREKARKMGERARVEMLTRFTPKNTCRMLESALA